jgi:predicted DNA-binding protein YlxM (UPF0122 family)
MGKIYSNLSRLQKLKLKRMYKEDIPPKLIALEFGITVGAVYQQIKKLTNKKG